MKKQLKLTAAALVLAATASTSFATTLDYVVSITDIDTIHTLAQAGMALAFGANSAEQNVGLVSQIGDENIAYINQGASDGTGKNFAAIVQNSTTATVGNVGYIFQTGSGNRAVIYQH